jgi:DNA-binding phage protein
MANTAFDEFFREQMGNPAFARAYRDARAEIDSVDALLRALDSARASKGLSKAALARETDLQAQTVRRLLTDKAANPTVATVLRLLRPMGLGLQIVPLARSAAPRKKARQAKVEKTRATRTSGRLRRAG